MLQEATKMDHPAVCEYLIENKADTDVLSGENDDVHCMYTLRVQSTPPTCCPRAIILPRSTKKHTHSISTKPFEAATCSDGLCVQLYNSTTYSKKETNTMNFVFYTPTVVLSAQKKFISATVRLSPAESNSKGVSRRGLYHNDEFLSISTLAFCIHTLSSTKNIITMAMCNIIEKLNVTV